MNYGNDLQKLSMEMVYGNGLWKWLWKWSKEETKVTSHEVKINY